MTLLTYPLHPIDIRASLKRLIEVNVPLTADAETYSLTHVTSGLASFSLAWSSKKGIAFPVDLSMQSHKIRADLKSFFENFNNKIIYHNASFDVYILVYQLFMKDVLDIQGMLYGLKVMLKNWDDTMYMAYLSLNACHRAEIDLKTLAAPFMGDYAKDIKDNITDITKIPIPKLLEYNLDDTKATWHVHDKYKALMIRDGQEGVYNNIYKPGMANIVQMQLSGMPIDPQRVLQLQAEIIPLRKDILERLNTLVITKKYLKLMREDHVIKRNAKLKTKRIKDTDAEVLAISFNPGSPTQLSTILYDDQFFRLPVLDKTKKGNPSTSSKTIVKLLNLINDPDKEIFINTLLDYKSSNKVYDTFLPAMLNATDTGKNFSLMFGKFNSTGTRSGRLSSNNVNLQQIPSTGTVWAKPVKKCIKPPPGKLLCGVDFDALEEKIGALTTKDPNRLIIYEKGIDGHCFRAFHYFGDEMTGIDINSVDSINSIQMLYPDLRQNSKVPTFLKQYGGTYIGLQKNAGFSLELAKATDARYDKMYQVSIAYTEAKVKEAAQKGYATLAFGLKLRTSILHKVVYGGRNTPYFAQKEARTIGNALGQSWGLLNVRAATEFMERVRSGPYANRITIIAQIHDAIYLLIDDDIDVLMYVNEHLIKAIQWQEDPLIAHPVVKLSGKLAVYAPTWAEENILPNNATRQQTQELLERIHNV